MSRLTQLNRQNLILAGRMALILIVVAAADGLVVEFARKPFPWVAIIPCSLPILMNIFVIFPAIQAGKAQAQKSA